MSNQIIKTTTDLNLSGKINGNAVNLLLLCDASSKAINITLPDSKNVKIASIVIMKNDSTGNVINVVCGLSGQTISGSSNKTVAVQYDVLTLYSHDSGYTGLYTNA